ncbi:isoprenyl transferase [Helicovermis profundi]|uniref:Isoprenyl transferase n=1 Tax=Helicovermis profundi TaxID=3065157 RepID=A0AAU9EIF0_9FIRM|nr:isoprenyl transferase [Clostridia bacterium S502]
MTKEKRKIPNHIAFIMDGNGRWAKKKLKPRLFGHKAGVEALKDIVKFGSKNNIGFMTFYAFSTENWSRPVKEVNGLMELLVVFLRKEIRELHENNVKITFIGKIDELPKLQKSEVNKAMDKTKDNTGLVFCIALNYGSRLEIVDACKSIVDLCLNEKLKGSDINEKLFESYLYTKEIPDPDLLIRTSGEKRLSNFLLWQLAYTEFYFTDVYWPDFNVNELNKAIDVYTTRNRRFGKVKEE